MNATNATMKNFFTAIAFFISVSFCKAQSYEGSVDYQKKDEKAMVIEFPYAPSIVEDAIIDKMEKMGYKKKESKGFLVFRNAVLKEISSEPADYMIRVEKKSRKERDDAVVYLLINRNAENIIARNDALVNSNAKIFLNGLGPIVEAFSLEKEIADQQDAIEKAEKKLKGLQDDKDNMERKIKKLQDDIKDNLKDQDDQQKELDRQKQVLDALKGKRKG
jgi:hypothetical protein